MNKVIIGIVILVLLVGIGLIVSSNRTGVLTNPPITSTPQVTESSTPQASTSAEVTQQQNVITLTSSGFSPATLTIKAGGEVTWVNQSGADATINSAPHPIHTDYPPLNLGAFPDGGTLSLAFSKAGTYKYHNHLNPAEFGTIIVQ